jgi:hypothetical protein
MIKLIKHIIIESEEDENFFKPKGIQQRLQRKEELWNEKIDIFKKGCSKVDRDYEKYIKSGKDQSNPLFIFLNNFRDCRVSEEEAKITAQLTHLIFRVRYNDTNAIVFVVWKENPSGQHLIGWEHFRDKRMYKIDLWVIDKYLRKYFKIQMSESEYKYLEFIK